MKRLAALLITALAMAAHAQSHRFPPIDLYTGDPTGVACTIPNSLVQGTTTGSLYSCLGGIWVNAASAAASVNGYYYAKVGDNLQTIINAVDTAGGGTIIIGPGDFSVGGTATALAWPNDGNCVNLLGAGVGVTTLPVIAQTATGSRPYGCRFQGFTINGGYPASSPAYGMNIWGCKGCTFENITVDKIAPASDGFLFGLVSGSPTLYESDIRNLTCEFDPNVYTSSALEPNDCVKMQGTATDNRGIRIITARNVAVAAVVDAGSNNSYIGVHQYGSTLALQANYSMTVVNNVNIDGLESDGVQIAGVLVAGHDVNITNSVFQWPFVTAGAYAVSVSGSSTNVTITNNTWWGIGNNGLTVPVNWNGNFYTGSTEVGNRPDFGQTIVYGELVLMKNLKITTTLTLPAGSAAAPSITAGTDATTGFHTLSAGNWALSISGFDQWVAANNGVSYRNTNTLWWSTGAPGGSSYLSCISVTAGGVVQIGHGACDTSGSISLNALTVAGTAAAALLSANAGTAGAPSITTATDATSGFHTPAAGQWSLALGGFDQWIAANTGFHFRNTNSFHWYSGGPSATGWDTCAGRASAGVFSIDTTTCGAGKGSLLAASLTPGILYSAAGTALPTCAVGIKGQQAAVSDATAPTYMGAYTSGGAITAAVICSYNGATYSWLTH